MDVCRDYVSLWLCWFSPDPPYPMILAAKLALFGLAKADIWSSQLLQDNVYLLVAAFWNISLQTGNKPPAISLQRQRNSGMLAHGQVSSLPSAPFVHSYSLTAAQSTFMAPSWLYLCFPRAHIQAVSLSHYFLWRPGRACSSKNQFLGSLGKYLIMMCYSDFCPQVKLEWFNLTLVRSSLGSVFGDRDWHWGGHSTSAEANGILQYCKESQVLSTHFLPQLV